MNTAATTAESAGLPSSRVSGSVSSSAAVVTCQALTKTFKDFWMRDRAKAVSNLSFEIRPREVFGLLGPNGSGKSTTIKMILGLLKPTSGRVGVFGKPPTDVSIKRRIGYLPEESYLYQFLNARETLDYYAKLFEIDVRTRNRRVDELLDMLGMTGAQFRPVREYSKGMQRRLGIAQALINDPDFLILDEPTTGLDPIGTRQIKDLIIELGRRGKTILLSSHLLADVEDCVDRLVILYGGQKRAEGTCDQLLESQNKTAIETDTLDEATLAEIDRVIRARSGNTKGVLNVRKPRQTLEALFLDIVDRARNEQLSTSGATSGGETASFLKDEEGGEQLIASLVNAAEAPARTPEADAAPVQGASQPAGAGANTMPSRPAGADAGMIDSLISGEKASTPAPRATPAAPAAPVAPPKEVDRSIIGSLLDDADRKDGGQQERRQ